MSARKWPRLPPYVISISHVVHPVSRELLTSGDEAALDASQLCSEHRVLLIPSQQNAQLRPLLAAFLLAAKALDELALDHVDAEGRHGGGTELVETVAERKEVVPGELAPGVGEVEFGMLGGGELVDEVGVTKLEVEDVHGMVDATVVDAGGEGERTVEVAEVAKNRLTHLVSVVDLAIKKGERGRHGTGRSIEGAEGLEDVEAVASGSEGDVVLAELLLLRLLVLERVELLHVVTEGVD